MTDGNDVKSKDNAVQDVVMHITAQAPKSESGWCPMSVPIWLSRYVTDILNARRNSTYRVQVFRLYKKDFMLSGDYDVWGPHATIGYPCDASAMDIRNQIGDIITCGVGAMFYQKNDVGTYSSKTENPQDYFARIEVLPIQGPVTKGKKNRPWFEIISLYGFEFETPKGYENKHGRPYVTADIYDIFPPMTDNNQKKAKATKAKAADGVETKHPAPNYTDGVPVVFLTLGQEVAGIKQLWIGQRLNPEQFGAVYNYLMLAGKRYGELKKHDKNCHRLTRRFIV